MKLRRARPARRGRIEIIPMIDVMFFLLATFMLTSLAMQRLDAVRVSLPQGMAERVDRDEPLTLSVTRTNQIFIDRQSVRLDQVTQAVARHLPRDGNILVSVHTESPKERDIAKRIFERLGARDVGTTTEASLPKH